jgi:HAD superfamily phosphatase (TIGR01668 family)
MKFLYPDIYAKNIKSVPYDKLLKKGITYLIFDIDNTLVPFDVPTAPAEIIAFLNDLVSKGFNVGLLSNNNQQRVIMFNQQLNYIAIHKAGKPKLSGINNIMSQMGAIPNKTAIIGDQIFTDIWCGNRKGITTILTRPIANRDEFTVKLKRGLESLVVKSFVAQVKSSKK